MRAFKHSFLAIGLLLTLGITVAMAAVDNDDKDHKKMGTLSVRTTEVSLPIKVDGRYIGMSGVDTAAEFFLIPGIHTIEVTTPDGKVFRDELEIRRQTRTCLCLKMISETITTPCPYRFHLEGPDHVNEGELITFAAINSGTAPVPLRYTWNVTPTTARITSGLGTPSITVDSKGLGGQSISAELD